jgi:hypothetical protein
VGTRAAAPDATLTGAQQAQKPAAWPSRRGSLAAA